MYLFQNIYTFFQNIFEYLTFRTKPDHQSIEDVEQQPNYEFIILNNKMIR